MQIKRAGNQAGNQPRSALAADCRDVPAVATDLDSVGNQDWRLAVSGVWVEVLRLNQSSPQSGSCCRTDRPGTAF